MIFNIMALTGIMPHAFPVTSAYTHLQMSLIHITHMHTNVCGVCMCTRTYACAANYAIYTKNIQTEIICPCWKHIKPQVSLSTRKIIAHN